MQTERLLVVVLVQTERLLVVVLVRAERLLVVVLLRYYQQQTAALPLRTSLAPQWLTFLSYDPVRPVAFHEVHSGPDAVHAQ